MSLRDVPIENRMRELRAEAWSTARVRLTLIGNLDDYMPHTIAYVERPLEREDRTLPIPR